MILRELGKVLVDIENYRYGYDENDRINVRTDKFLDDIPVQTLDVARRTEYGKKSQPMSETPHCVGKPRQMSCRAPCSDEQSAMLSFHSCCHTVVLDSSAEIVYYAAFPCHEVALHYV